MSVYSQVELGNIFSCHELLVFFSNVTGSGQKLAGEIFVKLIKLIRIYVMKQYHRLETQSTLD